jgi:hypothetical protein
LLLAFRQTIVAPQKYSSYGLGLVFGVVLVKFFYSPVKLALFFSALFLAFYFFWGTADLENSLKFDRAFGSRYAGFRLGDMAVSDGIGSFWGIPVFDATQGFGYRLPTQGALGQTPFIFLRWFASVEVIQMSYLVTGLFLCSWTIGQYCREHQKDYFLGSVLLLLLTLLGPLILFTVVNEWQVTALGFCSRVTLIIFTFHLIEKRRSGIVNSLDNPMCIASATAIFFIIVGHPGEWALALPIVLLAVLLLIERWHKSTSKIPKHVFKALVSPPLLIIYCSVFVFVLNVIDIFLETRRPVSSSLRQVQRFGITFEQLPRLSSFEDSKLLTESVVAFGMSFVGPVINLFVPTSGRYEFISSLLLALVVLEYLSRSNRVKKIQGSSIRYGLALASLIFLYYFSEILGVVPELMQSSGSWLHAPQLLLVTILLWLNCRKTILQKLSSSGKKKFLGKLTYVCKKTALVVAVGTIIVQPISLLKATSPQGMRNYEDSMSPAKINLLSNFRNSDLNHVPVSSANSDLYLAPSYVRAFEGFPVLENEPKVRNSSTLILSPVFNQVINSGRLEASDFSLFRNFASLQKIVSYEKNFFNSVSVLGGESSRLFDTRRGIRVRVTTRNEFHTFSIAEDDLIGDNSRCPLLEISACIEKIASHFSHPRSTPRWRLGTGQSVATYDWATDSGSWGVVIPMDFDKALKVMDRESKSYVRTYSHYGLLVAKIPNGSDVGSFEFFIDADWLMRLRSISSFFSLTCFGIAFLNVYLKKRGWGKNAGASWSQL